ncbi:MAG: Cof-type HAD-IIB family hydrolase [Chloroflexia bacterium]
MTIKLLALDLDGTIFGDDLLITPRTRKAIASAQAAGVVVTIATGRMFRAARHIAAELNIQGPLICYQGALVRDPRTDETLLHKTVPHHLAAEVVMLTSDQGLHLNVYLNDGLYVEKVTPEARFYSQINMDLPLNVVGDLRNWLDLQHPDEATKLVIVTSPEQTDAVLASYTEILGDRLQVTKSHPRFTEFTNHECSKGRALAQLAAQYGFKREEVMAIGDGHNDLDMLQWAGWGVAMETAPQAVRDGARIVCPPLAQDGAADAIERYILAAVPGQ